MGLLVRGDLLEVLVEKRVLGAGLLEILRGELLNTSGVESVLEVLEGQGVVEDDTVVDGRGSTLDRGGGGGNSQGSNGSGTHIDGSVRGGGREYVWVRL